MSSEQLTAIAFCWLIISLAVMMSLAAAEVKTTRTWMGVIIGFAFIPPAIVGCLAILTQVFLEHGQQ